MNEARFRLIRDIMVALSMLAVCIPAIELFVREVFK